MKKLLAAFAVLALGACAQPNQELANDVRITNCGQEVTLPKADHMLVNDGNLIATALSIGAQEQIAAVSSIQRDLPILKAKYGEAAASLHEIAKEYPSLEQIVAQKPDVYVAGWGYGLSESKGVTPEALEGHGIATYILSEACRQQGSEARGLMDPWQAVEEDLRNLGAISGHEERAKEVAEDQQRRLEKLNAAPKKDAPRAFVFDSGSDAILTSGKFGAPQAILEAAGASNATSDIADTWTSVSWERLAQAAPDVFVFVEYPGQELEQKIALLKEHPATKNLPAVKEERFINLPYAMWTSGPLNIDAAEHVRRGLEHFRLVPGSDITVQLPLPEQTPGQQYVR